MKLFAILLQLLAFVTVVAAWANPGACSGDCWTHDPALIRRRSDGTYFRFATGDLIGIWKAPDITGPWRYQGAVVPGGSSLPQPGNKVLWAPDVSYVGNRYVLYYSVSTFGSQVSAIGYATSPNMEAGSWTDHAGVGVSSTASSPYNAIDANLVQDADTGDYHLNFGSHWRCIYQYDMNAAATRVTGNPINISYNSTSTHFQEGAFVFHRNGYYYLFFSSGRCCNYGDNLPTPGNEYKIYVCRSQNVDGPYRDRNGLSCLTQNGGTLVLGSHGYVYGPGGQGVLSTPNHGTVLYYHYANKNIGLNDDQHQFGWNTITWSNGWPTV